MLASHRSEAMLAVAGGWQIVLCVCLCVCAHAYCTVCVCVSLYANKHAAACASYDLAHKTCDLIVHACVYIHVCVHACACFFICVCVCVCVYSVRVNLYVYAYVCSSNRTQKAILPAFFLPCIRVHYMYLPARPLDLAVRCVCGCGGTALTPSSSLSSSRECDAT